MLDNVTANAKTLALSVGSSIIVGLVVYALATGDNSALRARNAGLASDIDGLKAAQVSADQRLGDSEAKQKASAQRLDEIAARLEAIEKTIAPPAAAPVPPAEAQQPAPAPAAPAAPAH